MTIFGIRIPLWMFMVAAVFAASYLPTAAFAIVSAAAFLLWAVRPLRDLLATPFRRLWNGSFAQGISGDGYAMLMRTVAFRLVFADRLLADADPETVLTGSEAGPMRDMEVARQALEKFRPTDTRYGGLHEALVDFTRLQCGLGKRMTGFAGESHSGKMRRFDGAEKLGAASTQAAVVVRDELISLGAEEVEQLLLTRLAGLIGALFKVPDLLPLLDAKDLEPRRLGTMLLDYTVPVSCPDCGSREAYSVPLAAAGGSSEEAERLAVEFFHASSCRGPASQAA